jgi:hypothetical protein
MKTIIKNTLASDAFFMVNKTMLKYIGSANAAILLASFISKHEYFKKQGTLDGDSFFNTKEDITGDTGLTEQSILRAEKLLEKLGLIKSRLKGLPRRKYYMIQWKRIEHIMNDTLPAESVITEVESIDTQPLESVVRNHENIIGNDNQLIIPNEQKSMNKNNRIKMMAMDDDTWDAFINS